MTRWNGWGEESRSIPLPDTAAPFLNRVLGAATPRRDVTLWDAAAAVPASRLPAHKLVSTNATDRLRHARGQSLPDWIALRSGRIGAYPDGVARPSSVDEVRELLRWAGEVGARVIPYGGGTSVAGHINPPAGEAPVLTISMERRASLLGFNEQSQLATFGAGVRGPEIEEILRSRGMTLGHFPQSFEHSTLGGWIATRSSGQQSLRYGRIEQLFAGGTLVTPSGTLELAPFPASAAGPDLRELVLGSEGRFGLITDATVRVSRLPEEEAFHALFFPTWEQASAAVREIAQRRLPLAMLRLSTPVETETNLALAGHRRLVSAFEQVLGVLGAGDGKCMLIAGFVGNERVVEASRRVVREVARQHGGLHVGRTFGAQWHKHRFRSAYLRNALWEQGYGIDTLETAATWDKVQGIITAVDTALKRGLRDVGERVHVFTHLSHLYSSGSSVYVSYLFRLAADPEENLRRWQVLKKEATEAIVHGGGTISHQHGVGADHAPYLPAEKGPLGMTTLAALGRVYDPGGLMNPGKLF